MTNPMDRLLSRAFYALNARLFNPTRGWPPAQPGRLELDLVAGTLNGIALGGPLEALRPLGPSSGFSRIGRGDFDLHYGGLGLEVGFWEGEIVHFRFILSPAAWFTPTPFTPSSLRIVVPGGRSFLLGAETTERALGDWLGPPDDAKVTDVFGPSRSLSFQTGRCVVDAFSDLPTGRVIDFEVSERAAHPGGAEGSLSSTAPAAGA